MSGGGKIRHSGLKELLKEYLEDMDFYIISFLFFEVLLNTLHFVAQYDKIILW